MGRNTQSLYGYEILTYKLWNFNLNTAVLHSILQTSTGWKKSCDFLFCKIYGFTKWYETFFNVLKNQIKCIFISSMGYSCHQLGIFIINTLFFLVICFIYTFNDLLISYIFCWTVNIHCSDPLIDATILNFCRSLPLSFFPIISKMADSNHRNF